jgi:transcriptional regulator with XRE-family HTH domain
MAEDANKRLGILIASWREGAGLSQASLAEALHITQATVSKLESGVCKLGVVQLVEILDACGMRLADVADEVEEASGKEARPLWERIDE